MLSAILYCLLHSPVELFLLRAKEAFGTSSSDADTVLSLQDPSGSAVVISPSLPPGKYEAHMRPCNKSVASVVQQRRSGQEERLALSGFEKDMLQNVIADTLIANEVSPPIEH